MDEKKPAIKKEKKPTVKKAVPIEWYMPEGVMTPFASNMLIQTMENEFKVSFFELKPAVRISNSEPLPTKVRADCVASVIITADRLPKFITALQAQLNNYTAKKQAK